MANPPLRRSERSKGWRATSTVLIVVLNSVCLLTLQQFFYPAPSAPGSGSSSRATALVDGFDRGVPTAKASAASPFGWVIPQGRATALPSVPASAEEEASIKRSIYGGKGDKAHLGGFTSFDPMGVSPSLWKHMVNHLGIKSLLDLGCGRGISTSWFVIHGLQYVVCAEGSHDAVTQSLLPAIANVPNGTQFELVEHDFSRGPWWPSQTVDAAWCVEFTEHVGRNYQQNYHTAFHKAALIFASHSNWGGWHHVEVHDDNWWRVKMEAAGFVYSEILTKEARAKAQTDTRRTDLVEDMKTKNRTSYSVGQHLWGSMQVFINPLVASLPEHAHLFAEHGCYIGPGEKSRLECGKNGVGGTPLPESFKPLTMTDDMDAQWLNLIKDLQIL